MNRREQGTRRCADLFGGCRAVFALWLAAVCLVIVGSLCPASGSHRLHYDDLELNDKAVHFVNYTVLAILPLAALGFRRAALGYAASMIPLGGILELLQRLVPGRTCELGDFAADVLGVFAGVLLALGGRAAHLRWAADRHA